MSHHSRYQKSEFIEALRRATGPQDLVRRLRNLWANSERSQAAKMVHIKTRRDGAMHYLGLKIVRKMQEAGYPSRIFVTYRSPELQNEMFRKGRSKAHAWQSPHQYWEAVGIVHETKYWDVSPAYWEALATCVRIVADENEVDLNHGHYWPEFKDSAHIEIRNWRILRGRYVDKHNRPRNLTEKEILKRFVDLLPKVPLNDADRLTLSGPETVERFQR